MRMATKGLGPEFAPRGGHGHSFVELMVALAIFGVVLTVMAVSRPGRASPALGIWVFFRNMNMSSAFV